MRFLQIWWDLFRGALLWNLWLHRNQRVFLTTDAQATQTTVAIWTWHQICCYMKLAFKSLQQKLLTANDDRKLALVQEFKKVWGERPIGPELCRSTVNLPAIPLLTLLQ
jgi:hypothetical protein